MRIFQALLLSAALLAASLAPLHAAVRTDGDPTDENAAAAALSMLLAQCLPHVVTGHTPHMTGFTPVDERAARSFLAGKTGSVWAGRDNTTLMILYRSVPMCRVMAFAIDPKHVAHLVARAFAATRSPFQRERFRIETSGHFAAVYSGQADGKSVVIRVNTDERKDGTAFVVLGIERSP